MGVEGAWLEEGRRGELELELGGLRRAGEKERGGASHTLTTLSRYHIRLISISAAK